MTYEDNYLQAAYDNHSIGNEREVVASSTGGCFACFGTFPATQIWDFTSGTAFCPYCSMDTVIGDGSGLPVNDQQFLQALNAKIFDGPVFWDQISDPHPLTIGVRWVPDKCGSGSTGHPIYAENVNAPNQ